MIYCVWYPSGGFGHFLNAVLTMHGKNFAGDVQELIFSSTGDSHRLPLILPKFLHNPKTYSLPKLDHSLNYSVLVDNGIEDESTYYRDFFPGAVSIKVCYDDHSWPIVARTMIEKAMGKKIEQEIKVDQDRWFSNDDWAIREKYFLYLRDHAYRHGWRPDPDCYNLQIIDLLDYGKLCTSLSPFGVYDTFLAIWQQCMQANHKYLDPVMQAARVLNNLSNNIDLEISDVWTQAVINYNLWLRYGFEVPANDYAAWFTNTRQIAKMLQDHGIKI